MDLFTQNEKPKPRKFEKYSIKDGEVWFMPNFMPLDKTDEYYKALLNTINWKQEHIKMYGKTSPVPRKTAWYGDEGFSYKYSGINCNPDPWTKELLNIKKVIEHFVPNHKFNSVLLNLYMNGDDKVSWHADDESELDKNPTIASVSLGATRRFDLRHNEDSSEKFQIELTSGSLILMTGTLQHHWQHQIPVQKKVKDPRINLTFRTIVK
jgi:alkylated DNA repair dioxygenase AlkB